MELFGCSCEERTKKPRKLESHLLAWSPLAQGELLAPPNADEALVHCPKTAATGLVIESKRFKNDASFLGPEAHSHPRLRTPPSL